MQLKLLLPRHFNKLIFILTGIIGMLWWHTMTGFAETTPPVLWLEPVKTGYLTDGSAYCDLQIKSSDPGFSVTSLQTGEGFCLHTLQRNTMIQTPLQKLENGENMFRVVTPLYSSIYVFLNATFKNTDYLLQTPIRLLGKGYNAKAWLDTNRKSPAATPPKLSLASRTYAMKGMPVRFQYQRTEMKEAKTIQIYSPLEKKTESLFLPSNQTFTYNLPAAKTMKVDYSQSVSRVFINTVEENGKTLTHTAYIRFFDNRYHYRNLKHGLFTFVAGFLLAAAVFLWYMRRSSYHAH